MPPSPHASSTTANDDNQPAGASRERPLAPRRPFRPLRFLLKLSLQLLLLIVLLLGFVLGTQTGLRVAVGMAEDFAPDILHVGGVDGRILGELRLRDFSLTLPDLQVSLAKLHLDWHPASLFGGTLKVDELSAADIDIVAAPGPEKEPEPLTLPEIKLPIGIDIGRVLVERLSFNQTGAPPESALRLERAELSATANGNLVDLRRLEAILAQPDVRASASGSARLTGDYPVDLALDWRLNQDPALVLSGEGSITGDLSDLVIAHRVTGSADVVLDARVTSALETPAWTGTIQVNEVRLPEIVPDAPPVNLQAALETSGNLDDARLTGKLTGDAPELPDIGQLGADLDVSWSEKILAVRGLRLDETRSGAHLDLAGTVDLRTDTPAFALAGAWEQLRWPLSGDVLAQSPTGRLAANGDLDAFDYEVTAQAAGAQIPQTALTLRGTGNAESTQITQLLLETLGGQIEGKGRAAWAPRPEWDLALTAADIDPGRQWTGLDGRIGLKASSSGSLDDGFAYDAKIDTALDAYPPAVVNVTGTGTAVRADLQNLVIETLGGLIEGKGEVAWAPTPTWDLTLTGSDLDPGTHYTGLEGRIGLDAASSGGLEDGFAFRVQADANLSAYPPAVVDLSGTGTAEAATIETLAIQALGGRIDGGGDVGWAPQPRWDVALTAADLNPGSVAADWPGSIGGRIQSAGRIGEDGPVLDAAISDFGGRLRGYPVQLSADASVEGQAITLRTLSASSGDTRLSAGGRVAETIDLRFELDSPDLGALLPDAQGLLRAQGTVGGTPQGPQIDLTLTGSDVELNGQGIAQIGGRADIGLGPDGAFSIDIDGENLIAGGQRFATVAINGTGSMSAHRLAVDLKGPALGLELTADGGLGEAGAYSGSLQQLTLATTEFETWSLQQPAPFSLAGSSIQAGPLCIGNGADSGACVRFRQPEAGVFEVGLDADRIGLDLLNPMLPAATVVNGFVRANADFTARDNVLSGSATVAIPSGDIEVTLPDTKDRLVFSDSRLTVRSGTNGLDASLVLPLADVGGIDGEVSLPGFRLTAGPGQALRGDVDIALRNLARISMLIPDLVDVTGAITGNLGLAGTLGQPDIRGRLAIQNVGFRMPLYGLTVAETNIEAESRGRDSIVVDGSTLVGGGRLTISGSGSDLSGTPQLRFDISGDRLKVADSKEYFALVSTDLEFGLGPGGGALKGQITVPEARIMPRSIPSGTIQPSPDVVTEEQVQSDDGAPFHIDVLAKLGDEVSIDAFGLRGRLTGDLRVVKEPGRPLVGDGQLEVVDGTYRVSLPGLGVMTAIGKPLTIEQGIVVFAKTPIDNPGLILNAQREGGDVTAGVRVLGTIKDPKLAFFSESDPNMTQSEISRYLVTGIPPKGDSDADDRALSVGTYVAPKLFMEYESSLGEQSDKVKLRYDLSKHIEVQTETGDSQGADIFYKFEN
ncbi:MAG: translocation/assembly module TamB domain-containing protein [Thiohalocapsa sp.]|nr:translocation/assembly module TamB domain-containing protein [Thiohalocapsa sp.]